MENNTETIFEHPTLETVAVFRKFFHQIDKILGKQKKGLEEQLSTPNKGGDNIQPVVANIVELFLKELDPEIIRRLPEKRLRAILNALGDSAYRAHNWGILQIYGEKLTDNIISIPFGGNLAQHALMGKQRNRRILIVGESGVGKEAIAEIFGNALINLETEKHNTEYVKINASTLSKDIGIVQLCGALKGSYTDCKENKEGLIEKIKDGGCLFLDEIADMPYFVQPDILRLINDGSYRMYGGTKELKARFHLVTATNRPIEELRSGTNLRFDLYQRVSTDKIIVPSLRNLLLEMPMKRVFTAIFLYEMEQKIKEMDIINGAEYRAFIFGWMDDAIDILMDFTKEGYPWTGNLRECSGLIQKILYDSTNVSDRKKRIREICGESLPTGPGRTISTPNGPTGELCIDENNQIRLRDKLREEEERFYRAAAKNAPDIKAISTWLGIPPSTVARKMNDFKIRCGGERSIGSRKSG